jgi:hypothetical protein
VPTVRSICGDRVVVENSRAKFQNRSSIGITSNHAPQSLGHGCRLPHHLRGFTIAGLRRLRLGLICGRFIVPPGAAGAIGPTAKAHATGADDSNKASRIADTGLAFRRCVASSCACTFRSTKAILISFSPFDPPEMQKRRLRSQKSNTRTKVQPSPSRDADF